MLGDHSDSTIASNTTTSSLTDSILIDNPFFTPQTSSFDNSTLKRQSRYSSTSVTSRARLTITITNKKTRKRKRSNEVVEEEMKNSNNTGAKQRLLDRVIRWNTFIYFTNDLWKNIVEQIYGKEIDINSNKKQTARSKIFDCVKDFKNRVIENMKVCYPPCKHWYSLTYDNSVIFRSF